MIEVSADFNMELFGYKLTQQPMFRKYYKLFLKATLENKLAYLFAPNTLFKRGYERTDELDVIINTLALNDQGIDYIIRVENVIGKYLSEYVSQDGQDYYGVYRLEDFIRGNQSGFFISLIGDYRIMEWNDGRGKPIEKEDERVEIEAIIAESKSQLPSDKPGFIIYPRIQPTRYLPMVADIQFRKQLDDIIYRLENDGWVSSSELALLQDHDHTYVQSKESEYSVATNKE